MLWLICVFQSFAHSLHLLLCPVHISLIVLSDGRYSSLPFGDDM